MRPSFPTPQRLQPIYICVVSTYDDSRNDLHRLCQKFQGLVSVNDFRLLFWLQKLLQAPLCSMRSFCFAPIRLDPWGGPVMHHDCISMIVSRFTAFTKNFLIWCYHVTKIFCTRYGSANASSARSPGNFGPLTDLAISVFEEVSINTAVYQNPHFS